MNIKFKRVALTIAAVCGLALVGCSSTSHEPAELEDINQLVDSDSVWSQSVGSSVTGLVTPFLTQSGLYAAGGNTLYKLDPKTGEEEWAVETDAEISAGVGSDGEFVAVGTVKGEVEVFDATGKKLWSARLSSEMSVPPLVGAGFVIVRTADTRITAFDAASGERRWRYQSQVPALTVRAASSMRFSPAGILVGQSNGRLLALDGHEDIDLAALEPLRDKITEFGLRLAVECRQFDIQVELLGVERTELDGDFLGSERGFALAEARHGFYHGAEALNFGKFTKNYPVCTTISATLLFFSHNGAGYAVFLVNLCGFNATN